MLSVVVEDATGTRQIDVGEFPLAMGGSRADIELPDIFTPEPAAYLGFENGDIFVQPAGSDPVMVNGTTVSTSQWLRDRDVVRVGGAEIHIDLTKDSAHLRVDRWAPARKKTEPPLLQTPGQSAGKTVKPAPFQPKAIDTSGRGRGAFHTHRLLVWALLAALGAGAWLVFTSRSVALEVEPAPEALEIEGGWFVVELGGRFLVRQGSYTVVADKEGYHRLEAPFEVTGEPRQSFRFSMEKLPGRLAVVSHPADGATVVIDGNEAGVTPLEPVELAPGEHDLVVRASGYREYRTRVELEGGGLLETVEVDLDARWAPITFNSTPPGARVLVDGRSTGTTPLTTDILEGGHAYKLTLPGYKQLEGRFGVVAGEARTLALPLLEPLDGYFTVTTEPPGATITVDGQFRGESPMELAVVPGRPHEIAASKAGFERVAQQVELASGERRELTLSLVARLGELELVVDPPDAELFVNGESRGAAHRLLQLPAVPQQIEIRKPGYETFGTNITPRPGFPQTIEVTLKTLEEAKADATPGVTKTSEGQELRLIEPRRIRMGASRREPGRRANETLRDVELTRRFYLSSMEVSNREFRKFQNEHRSGSVRGHNLERDDHPAVRLTWEDAAGYCNWLSAKEALPLAYEMRDGKLVAAAPPTTGYRLPTEAEWVLAARYGAGDQPLKYPWGSALPVAPNSGNYADVSAKDLLPTVIASYNDSFPATAPVDHFPASGLGLYNLGGNVAEWVHDYYTIYSASAPGPTRDPAGPKEGEFHVIRGSSWMHGTVSELRLSYRDYGNKPRPDLGFRIARYAE